MKVIDLNKRTIYVDDIEQIYRETNYSPERYNVQTTYGTYLIDQEDYYKVKDYLLSLNDEVEILEEEKKIPKKICTNRIINTHDILEFEMIQNKINAEYTYAINSIIDYLKSKGE